ncbi:MAG: hypothetical protein GX458_08790, partial [Phyllobacteriaceae bacterium]|nr:hypothetical protein [Phyllobacteriaceae bacterium]
MLGEGVGVEQVLLGRVLGVDEGVGGRDPRGERLRQGDTVGVAAVGMTFVVLLGGIDLSIGSQISMINVVTAFL